MAGNGFGTEDSRAPFDDVEVKLQDPRLGEQEFHDGDERGFHTLANPGGTGGQEEILHQLLGDGGGPSTATGLAAFIHGVFHFNPIEAMVLEEAGVFSGYQSVLQGGRNLRHGHEFVFFVVRKRAGEGLDAALQLDGGGDGGYPAQQQDADRHQGIEANYGGEQKFPDELEEFTGAGQAPE